MSDIIMPRMTDTMETGVLVSWFVKVGDKVKSGDIIAEIETDKAIMDLEVWESGYITYIGIEEGERIPINNIIAKIENNVR
jgi:pyruvate dehydrogenase E2 component (dihydrolipoamide acetyltransferase)